MKLQKKKKQNKKQSRISGVKPFHTIVNTSKLKSIQYICTAAYTGFLGKKYRY